jgi:hypothetical protein
MKKIKISILACTLFLSFGCENILEENLNLRSYLPISIALLVYWEVLQGFTMKFVTNGVLKDFSSEMQAGTDEFVQGASSGGDLYIPSMV